MAAINPGTLPVCRVDEIQTQASGQTWLIRSLWSRSAVGIVGGAPKCCKSWLGLDMAISVATNTPCLGRFEVEKPGRTLVFLAEDALHDVRARIESICRHRKVNLSKLDLLVVTASSIRLDLARDQQLLEATLKNLRPKLLILDPLVRLHCLDENSASEISGLLGFIRRLQREFDTAIVLVHHASKKSRAQPGQALRGSSDLHAFGDSNIYLTRKNEHIVLTTEHRTKPASDPIEIQLVRHADNVNAHLEIVGKTNRSAGSLGDQVRRLLSGSMKPMTRTQIRKELKVNNERLGKVLGDLETSGFLSRSRQGWFCSSSKNAAHKTPKKKRIKNQQTQLTLF